MSKISSSGKRVSGVLGDTAKGITQQTDLSNQNYSLPFFAYCAVAKNTLSTAPYTVDFALPIGIIHRVWVEFPKGCAGLVGVQIHRGPYQIFPLPEDTWLKSDNAIMNFAFTHDMTKEPYNVTLKVYNEDDTYQHTVWIGLEMRGQSKDIPPQLAGFLNYIGIG